MVCVSFNYHISAKKIINVVAIDILINLYADVAVP